MIRQILQNACFLLMTSLSIWFAVWAIRYRAEIDKKGWPGCGRWLGLLGCCFGVGPTFRIDLEMHLLTKPRFVKAWSTATDL
jgi:hypothetical protein